MLVVKKDLEGFYEEKKSKFYTYIFKVESKEEIASKIQKIKDENPQARHIYQQVKIKNLLIVCIAF